MANKNLTQRLSGVWSASPTPFTDKMQIDKVSVRRLVEHHIRLGVKGLFLCGTCGEGPWMTDGLRETMIAQTAKCNAGRMLLSVQITDNSEMRMLENIKMAKRAGADIAIIAPPYFPPNGHTNRLRDVYLRTIEGSSLPIGIYDRGKHSSTFVPNALLRELALNKKVVLFKDSSADMTRMRLLVNARKENKNLRLMTGWEFNTVPYIKAGYDGLLLGGGIFNGYLAGLILEAGQAGDFDKAEALQLRLNNIMYDTFGGKKLTCWLSGQKRLLTEMGIFRTWKSILEYPLTAACEKKIKQLVKRDSDVLFPWR